MQELEKILKEIDEIKVGFDTECRSECDLYDWSCGACVGECDEYIKARAKDIIRKHMNDGWIPVERRLPINHEGAVEATVGAGYRTVGYYDQYREEWWTLDEDSILDVIAWKGPSEPYRPERSEE